MIIIFGFAFSLLVFFVLFWFFSKAEITLKNSQAAAIQAQRDMAHTQGFTISSKDIDAIAGDDVVTTQLDLARAYIETDRRNLAKNILNNVKLHGSSEQQNEAKRLLESVDI